MKRMVSLILTLAMVLSLMAGITVGVGAEGEYIYLESAEVNGTPIPELQVGDPLPELSYTVPEGANYTVSAYWWENDLEVPAGTIVQDGNEYRLWIKVVANEGYAFAYGSSLLINGEEHSYMPVNARGEGFEYYGFYRDYPFLTPIDKVELSYAEPVKGQPQSEVTVADGALYTADMEWYDYNEHTWMEPGTVVEAGDWFYGQIDAYPAEGYMFTADTEVWVNGVKITEDYECYFHVKYDNISVYTPEYDFCEPVAEAYVTYTEPVVGQPLPMPVAGTGNYAVDENSTSWYDYTAGEWLWPGTVAEKGHIYYLDLWVKPAEGYKFTEDAELYVNGALVNYNEGSEGCIVWQSEDYAFCDPIAKIELSYDEPVAGQPLDEVSAPADALYEVHNEWYDYHDVENHSKAPGTVAVKGHRYDAEIYVSPVEGYMFTEATEIWVNGEKLTVSEDSLDYVAIDSREIYIDTREYLLADPVAEVHLTYAEPVLGQVLPIPTVSGEGVVLGQWNWNDYYIEDVAPEGAVAEKSHSYELGAYIEAEMGYYISKDTKFFVNGEEMRLGYDVGYEETGIYYFSDPYSFTEKLNSVSFTLEDLAVGQAFPKAVAPAGAQYEVYTEWYDLHADEYVTEDAVAQDGRSYEVIISLYPAKGYGFTEDVTLIVNGTAASSDDYRSWEDELNFSRSYTFADPVAKVELPAIPELKLGDTLPELSGSGNNYSYTVTVEGYDADGEPLTGNTVVEGGQYTVLVEAEPAAGYEFTGDTVFTVGGKTPSAFAYSGRAYFVDYKFFCFDGTEVINQVSLSTAVPAIGQKGGEVSVAADESYVLEYYAWGVAPGGDMKEADETVNPYQAGDHVLLAFDLFAQEGTMFSADLTVKINGKTYTPAMVQGYPRYMMVLIDLGEAKAAANYNGLTDVDGVWGYYIDGVLQVEYTGLVEYNGVWFYVENGIVNWDYTGLCLFNGVWFYVSGGAVDWAYEGLCLFNGTWFYITGGQVNWDYTGLVLFNGYWMYVSGGMVDWEYVGLTQFNGYWMYVAGGFVDWEYVGMTQFNGYWFYVANGLVDWEYVGLTQYNGYWFYISGGMVNWEYVGLVPFNGALIYVANGMVDWSYSGTANYNGVDYNVENGMVVW